MHRVVVFLTFAAFFWGCSSVPIETNKVNDTEPYLDSLYFGAILNSAGGAFNISKAVLTWGKWIRTPGSSIEIESPVKKIFYPGVALEVASSGRSLTPSGTAG